MSEIMAGTMEEFVGSQGSPAVVGAMTGVRPPTKGGPLLVWLLRLLAQAVWGRDQEVDTYVAPWTVAEFFGCCGAGDASGFRFSRYGGGKGTSDLP
jgi:hypothetical protein